MRSEVTVQLSPSFFNFRTAISRSVEAAAPTPRRDVSVQPVSLYLPIPTAEESLPPAPTGDYSRDEWRVRVLGNT